MEIKLKMNDILTIYNVIKTIIDDSQAKSDVVLKFKLLGIMKVMEPHIANFEVIQSEKIMEYGKKKEDGNYQIPKEDTEAIEKFKAAIKPILESEITLCIDALTPDDIFNKGVRAEYLSGLYPIIRL